MTNRPTFEQFKKTALNDPAFREEYDALETVFQMKRRMIAMRKAAGLTQAQMAEKLGTQRSNISRLESVSAANSPSLATIEDYARALGYSVIVEFQPHASENR